MQFKILAIPLFIASVSAGWVELCNGAGVCTDMGSNYENNCMGPINGKNFRFTFHGDETPASMAIFPDKNCFQANLNSCTDCKEVKYGGKGPAYALFHK